MIDKKYQSIVFAFFMAFFMSCLMSLVITVINLGVTRDTIFVWLRAWPFAFCIGFPTVTLVAPLVRRLVTLVIRQD